MNKLKRLNTIKDKLFKRLLGLTRDNKQWSITTSRITKIQVKILKITGVKS